MKIPYVAMVVTLLLGGVISASDVVKFHHTTIDSQAPTNLHTKGVGDFNGDGLMDVLVAGTEGAIVWYEAPRWNKHVIVDTGGGWSTDAESGDLDGDGDLDVVISDWYQNNRIV